MALRRTVTATLLLAVLLVFVSPIRANEERDPNYAQWDSVYDYIVVGAGQAGCVAARKLSDAGHSVLVLERGTRIPANNTDSQILGLATLNWVPPFISDNVLQTDSQGHRPDVFVGAMEGGGGMVNSAISHLGAKNWWATFPQPTWDFASQIAPAFARLQTRLSLLPPAVVPAVSVAFLASGGAATFVNPNLNNVTGNPSEGFGNLSIASTIGPGGFPIRDSTLFAYLDGVNPNLVDISLQSTATRIVFNNVYGYGGVAPKAKGVRFIANGSCQKAKASKGVIVSAGAFGSADLLLRSGVGPATQVEDLGIQLVSNLPVGQGLQDHHTIALAYINLCPFTAAEAASWIFTPGTQVAGFINSNVSVHNWPDIQYTFAPLPTQAGGVNLFELAIFLVDPQSRGTVTLANQDPLKPTLKSYSYPGTTRDVEALTYAVEFAEAFMATGPMAACFGPRVSPAAGTNLPTWIAANAEPTYHVAGTNAVGSVVDQNLAVLGTKNLYVVDASVMPFVAPCNTGLPTAIIAERAIPLILSARR